MGKTLEAMRALQAIERQLADVRRQFSSSSAAVGVQQEQVDELRHRFQSLHDETLSFQKEAGAVELELKSREEDVGKLRQSLNSAKTNKEYAAALTQLNTLKADNSKLEDKALKLMQEVDQVKADTKEVEGQIAHAEKRLEQVRQVSGEETARFQAMLDELQAKRDSAAEDVPPRPLSVFDRIATIRDGDVMAKIEAIGKKPPYQYICGGCNMSIAAEHANALQTRDEIRFCDCCGRILYIQEQESAHTT
ncbi:MAG: hypothetical protein K8R91_01140 [Phycisphaerae bacterium]|nr:hypothetical protein [Phycisphaerae bacterium]